MESRLTLTQMQKKLEEMFIFTSGLALGSNFVEDTRIAAAQASAQIAGMLMGIHEFKLMLGILPDLGPGDDGEGPGDGLGFDPDGEDDGLDLDEGFDSEPE